MPRPRRHIRANEDCIVISFAVKRAEHGELFEWLRSLPCGSLSMRVRDILDGALERVAARQAQAPVPPLERCERAQGAGAPAPAARARPAVARETDSPEGQFTREVAELLLAMNKEFS